MTCKILTFLFKIPLYYRPIYVYYIYIYIHISVINIYIYIYTTYMPCKILTFLFKIPLLYRPKKLKFRSERAILLYIALAGLYIALVGLIAQGLYMPSRM